MKRKTNIKYYRYCAPRAHADSSFRDLQIDDDNHPTVSSVLGLNRALKVATSDAVRLLAKLHMGSVSMPQFDVRAQD